MKIYRESGLFTGEWNGLNTFPAEAPDRTIDYILVPKGWELVEHRVIRNDASDHCAILSVFEIN